MIGLLGKKVGMTQIFDEEGQQIPVTVVECGPCIVTSVRTKEKNGYSAVQLGFDRAKERLVTSPSAGQFKKIGVAALKFVREIRTEELENVTVGSQILVDNFEAGDWVDVEGISIGKGFQGVVKRHHFRGGEKAHGSKMGREPGSIGSSAFPSRVIKGLGMPGHMGDEQVTTQNLKVVKVDAEKNLLAIRGAVPGVEGSYLVIRQALKRGKPRKWKVIQPAGKTSKESPSSESSEKKKSEEKK
jgi:large subunit ribosomal protein L3